MNILLSVLVFLGVGTGLLLFILVFSWLVRPINNRKKSEETYECGFPAKGERRALGFNFIDYAILFLVFDLMAIFLFLYASAGAMSTQTTIIFLGGIVLLGLLLLTAMRGGEYYVT